MLPRLAALLPLIMTVGAAQTICPPTPAYSVCDISFDVPGGPGPAPELNAEFRGPSHRTFLVRGFPTGGSRLVVRFNPFEPGTWDVRLTGNVPAYDGKLLHITATASDAPGWIEVANSHHFRYSGNGPAHLWVGDRLPDGLDRAAFERFVTERSRLKINHVRVRVPNSTDDHSFDELDARLAFINAHGITADLILTPPAGNREARQVFFSYVIARCAARNATWVLLDEFEKYDRAHDLLREIAGYLNDDPYHHLKTAGARVTSGPFADEKWMSYRAYGSGDPSISAIEDQIYLTPAVSDFTAGETLSGDEFRHRLWNSTVTGAYPSASTTDEAAARYLGVWQAVFADTRHWDLEPFFDVEGARGIALPQIEYILYLEKPGPVTVQLENKHAWEAAWINPLNGERTELKKFKEATFTGEPPDNSHDWVLHISREGRKESMLKSYRFEALPVVLQEVEADPKKAPFEIAQPTGDALPFAHPSSYAVKLLRETRATRRMTYLWTGEVTADGENYRVLGAGPSGIFQIPANVVRHFPATLHVRLFGLNANGKLYSLDQNIGITQ